MTTIFHQNNFATEFLNEKLFLSPWSKINFLKSLATAKVILTNF